MKTSEIKPAVTFNVGFSEPHDLASQHLRCWKAIDHVYIKFALTGPEGAEGE
jgi:hypothetical protein